MNSDSRRRSILIVDDTPGNLQALSEILRQRGYRPRPVLSGKLAIQAAINDPPSLVLLDIFMRDMDGYEVCRKLKACEDLKEIPVIFISALDDSIDKVRRFKVAGSTTLPNHFERRKCPHAWKRTSTCVICN